MHTKLFCRDNKFFFKLIIDASFYLLTQKNELWVPNDFILPRNNLEVFNTYFEEEKYSLTILLNLDGNQIVILNIVSKTLVLSINFMENAHTVLTLTNNGCKQTFSFVQLMYIRQIFWIILQKNENNMFLFCSPLFVKMMQIHLFLF